MNEKAMIFEYTDKEIKNIIFEKGVYLAPILPLLASIILTIYTIKTSIYIGIDNADKIGLGSLYLITIIAFIFAYKIKKELTVRVKKEQEVIFSNSKISFGTVGENLSYDLYTIKKIRKTKYFYIVEFNFNKGDSEFWQIKMDPHIPCRLIAEQDMEELAAKLKIKFK